MDVDVWPAQLPLMPRKYLATTFHVQGVPEVRIPEIDRESITNEGSSSKPYFECAMRLSFDARVISRKLDTIGLPAISDVHRFRRGLRHASPPPFVEERNSTRIEQS